MDILAPVKVSFLFLGIFTVWWVENKNDFLGNPYILMREQKKTVFSPILMTKQKTQD